MPESETLHELLALVTEEWREKLGGRKCDWHYTSPWHDFSALLADFDDMERLGEIGCGQRCIELLLQVELVQVHSQPQA
jgi:hypothetical protein